MKENKKACFLDRDGCLIEERNYLSDPAQVCLCPGVPEALRLLEENGYLRIVVSNQSGIARGYFTMEQLRAVERRIDELLAEHGVRVDAWYYCPHHKKGVVPEYAVDCDCRKPLPGMLLRAAEDFSLDRKQCIMIGDRISDLRAGLSAGCRAAALVRTGYGRMEDLSLCPGAADAADLPSAVRMLIR